MPNQPFRLARPKSRTEPASPADDEPPPPTKRNRPSEQTKARKQNKKCDGPADHLLTRAKELQDAFAQGTSGDEAIEIWMVHAAAGHRDRLKESCLAKAPVRHLPGRVEGVFGPHGAHFEEAACRLRFCKGNPLTIRNFLILADEAGKWISALKRDHLAELERIGMDCRALSEPDDEAKWIWTLFEVAWLRVGDDEPLDRDFLRADRWVWSNEFNTQSRYVPGSSEQLWANVDAVEASIPRIRQELKQLGEQPAKIDEMERQTRASIAFHRSPVIRRCVQRGGPPDWYYSWLSDAFAASALAFTILPYLLWGDGLIEDPALNPKERKILIELLEAGSSSGDRPMTTKVLARRIRPGSIDHAFLKRPVARLGKLKLVDSRDTPGGGIWLTPSGIRRARLEKQIAGGPSLAAR